MDIYIYKLIIFVTDLFVQISQVKTNTNISHFENIKSESFFNMNASRQLKNRELELPQCVAEHVCFEKCVRENMFVCSICKSHFESLIHFCTSKTLFFLMLTKLQPCLKIRFRLLYLRSFHHSTNLPSKMSMCKRYKRRSKRCSCNINLDIWTKC